MGHFGVARAMGPENIINLGIITLVGFLISLFLFSRQQFQQISTPRRVNCLRTDASSHNQLQKHVFNSQGSAEMVPGHSAAASMSAENLGEKSWTANEEKVLEDDTNDTKHFAGVAFRNLNVHGFGTTTDYQKTFANYPLACLSFLGILFGRVRKSRIDILREFDGLVSCGELLLVLGRPGSGCTTFLKTLAGHTHGLHVDQGSEIGYQGKTIDGSISSIFMV